MLVDTAVNDHLVHDFNQHGLFCRESLRIKDLQGSLVPMIEGAGQRKLTEVIRRQRRAGKPVRIAGLKTRRSWFTAGATSHLFREVAFYPGREGFVVADHYRPAALEAFGYLEDYQKNYVPFERHGQAMHLTPLVKSSEMVMEWQNGSKLEVYSADAGEIRGGGRQMGLLDECAFWRNPEKTLNGVMNMVPKKPGTMILVISTANGQGGEFYELCEQAQDSESDTMFEFLFFGWLEHEQYVFPFESLDHERDFMATLGPEEKALVELHNATPQQLHWRRLTIATECRGKLDVFHQEYPTTAEEAWIVSGKPALDLAALARYHPKLNGTYGDLKLFDDINGLVLRFIPNDGGIIEVFRKPEAGHRYVIGADPSKGKDVSGEKRGKNPDFSVAFVADQDTGEQVALYRARTRPGPFGEQLALLGRWYNYAFLCPESNDAGFIDALVKTNYPVERIYQRRRDPTDRRPATIEELGFETTTLTRSWLVAAADDAIREASIVIHSRQVMSECQTFVNVDGKPEHMPNHHDDCVIALGLAEIARRFAPRIRTLSTTATTARGARGVTLYGGVKRRAAGDDDE